MSDIRAHSFDAPRERAAPKVLDGVTPAGDARRIELDRMTLVVAVKPECDGCRDFLRGEPSELGGVAVVVVSATASEEWRGAPTDVLIAPELMKVLDIRSAPFYVLLDPKKMMVVGEGVVFGPSQVATEIASLLQT